MWHIEIRDEKEPSLLGFGLVRPFVKLSTTGFGFGF